MRINATVCLLILFVHILVAQHPPRQGHPGSGSPGSHTVGVPVHNQGASQTLRGPSPGQKVGSQGSNNQAPSASGNSPKHPGTGHNQPASQNTNKNANVQQQAVQQSTGHNPASQHSNKNANVQQHAVPQSTGQKPVQDPKALPREFHNIVQESVKAHHHPNHNNSPGLPAAANANLGPNKPPTHSAGPPHPTPATKVPPRVALASKVTTPPTPATKVPPRVAAASKVTTPPTSKAPSTTVPTKSVTLPSHNHQKSDNVKSSTSKPGPLKVVKFEPKSGSGAPSISQPIKGPPRENLFVPYNPTNPTLKVTTPKTASTTTPRTTSTTTRKTTSTTTRKTTSTTTLKTTSTTTPRTTSTTTPRTTSTTTSKTTSTTTLKTTSTTTPKTTSTTTPKTSKTTSTTVPTKSVTLPSHNHQKSKPNPIETVKFEPISGSGAPSIPQSNPTKPLHPSVNTADLVGPVQNPPAPLKFIQSPPIDTSEPVAQHHQSVVDFIVPEKQHPVFQNTPFQVTDLERHQLPVEISDNNVGIFESRNQEEQFGNANLNDRGWVPGQETNIYNQAQEQPPYEQNSRSEPVIQSDYNMQEANEIGIGTLGQDGYIHEQPYNTLSQAPSTDYNNVYNDKESEPHVPHLPPYKFRKENLNEPSWAKNSILHDRFSNQNTLDLDYEDGSEYENLSSSSRLAQPSVLSFVCIGTLHSVFAINKMMIDKF